MMNARNYNPRSTPPMCAPHKNHFRRRYQPVFLRAVARRNLGDQAIVLTCKHGAGRPLIESLAPGDVFMPVQGLGPLFRIRCNKASRPVEPTPDALLACAGVFQLKISTSRALIAEMELCADHGLRNWDARIVSAATDHSHSHSHSVLLSENLQRGFIGRGVTVVNPYADAPHPLPSYLLP